MTPIKLTNEGTEKVKSRVRGHVSDKVAEPGLEPRFPTSLRVLISARTPGMFTEEGVRTRSPHDTVVSRFGTPLDIGEVAFAF